MWRIFLGCHKICFLKGHYYYYYKGENSEIHKSEVSERFCKDFLEALKYREQGLKDIKSLKKAIAYSYLIYCPKVYCYAKKIKGKNKKEILLEAHGLFKKNYKIGKEYRNLRKGYKLFYFFPLAFYYIEEIKNKKNKVFY